MIIQPLDFIFIQSPIKGNTPQIAHLKKKIILKINFENCSAVRKLNGILN